MIYFIVPAAGAFSICEVVSEVRPALADRFRIIHYEDLFAQKQFHRGSYVLAALDQLSPTMRQLVCSLHEQLTAVAGVRILNHPRRSLQRFDLLSKLYELRRNDFRAVRASDDFTKLRYPVFVRGERSHDGALTPLLDSPRQVEAAIGKAVIQGRPFSDLLVVEFCPTADDEGLYRKYGAFIVDKRIIARHINQGMHWMTKWADAKFTEELMLAERDYVFNNPHESELAEIFRIANIDYGRIDYAMKNGRVQTWEINLNPTINRGPGPRSHTSAGLPPEIQAIRNETKGYFFDRFQEAWQAIDTPASLEPVVTLNLDQAAIKAATAESVVNGRFLAGLRAIVRPIKPVVEPLANPFLRGITSLMKSRHSR